MYVRDVINKYNNGARKKLNKIEKDEEELLIKAIARHSDKELYSDDPFIELLKDVDSLDRYLHGIKSEGVYLERCNNLFKELGIECQEVNKV